MNPRLRGILVNALIMLASFAFILLALEAGFRVYSVFSPPPPEALQTEFIRRFVMPNSYGEVRPHVDFEATQFFPTLQITNSPFHVRTNAYGMRMGEVSLEKDAGVFRIAAMGDSSTFGWMLDEDESYPQQLETLLNQAGSERYEALNFGVPGYTSYHGLKQYQNLVQRFKPDALILAYGFNDSYEARLPENELFERMNDAGLLEPFSALTLILNDSSRLFRWVFGRIASVKKQPIEALYHERAQRGEWHARVSRQDYIENLSTIIEDAQGEGREVILLHLNLPNTWVKEPLRFLANEYSLPLIDVQELFSDYVNAPQPELIDSESDEARFLFRVKVPESVEINDAIYIVGGDPALGDWTPNTVRMYDDGTHGDERAGDRIWTLETQLSSDGYVDYAFTNSGPAGQWQEAEPVYENTPKAIRHYHHVNAGEVSSKNLWVSPLHIYNIDPFHEIMVPGDPIHPNAEGQRLIADALAREIQQLD